MAYQHASVACPDFRGLTTAPEDEDTQAELARNGESTSLHKATAFDRVLRRKGINEHCSDELKNLLRRMFHVRPAARFPSIRELLQHPFFTSAYTNQYYTPAPRPVRARTTADTEDDHKEESTS